MISLIGEPCIALHDPAIDLQTFPLTLFYPRRTHLYQQLAFRERVNVRINLSDLDLDRELIDVADIALLLLHLRSTETSSIVRAALSR